MEGSLGTEQDLIKRRKDRVKELGLYRPTGDEFYRVVIETWKKVLAERGDGEELKSKIKVQTDEVDKTKYYAGRAYTFAAYFGPPFQPQYNPPLIVVFRQDVLAANFWQEDLVREHLVYILEHELRHYFGEEDSPVSPSKEEFNYL